MAKNRQKEIHFACLKKLANLGRIPTQPPLYGTIGQKSVLLPTSNEFKIFLIITISIVGSRQPDGSGHMTLLCCRFLTAGRLLTSQCRFSLPIRRCFSINACLCAGLPSMPFKGPRQKLKYANQILLGLLLCSQDLLLFHDAW